MSMVSITKHQDYHLEEITTAVRTHFKRFQLEQRLSANTKVLIKPNLLMKRRPEEFTTTHPTLVEAAIICLKELGVKHITVADSPGGLYTVSALRGIYQASGMMEVCKRQKVTLNEDISFQEKGNPSAVLVKKFPLIQPVIQADFILDICKLKSHAMTGLSGAVKNLFGCIPGLTKPEFHWRFPEKEQFCQMLVDLCETVKPDFVLVDAIHAMEGDGPSGGTMRKVNRILASNQPYDLDYCLCQLIGVLPERILTVSHSIQRGLCCGDLCDIQIVGESLQTVPDFQMPQDKGLDFMAWVPKFLRKPAKAITEKFLTSRPKIRTADCIGCGKCAESCPPKTIQIVDRKAKINDKNCIRCFCCHEMCPVKAIDIKRSRLFLK